MYIITISERCIITRVCCVIYSNSNSWSCKRYCDLEVDLKVRFQPELDNNLDMWMAVELCSPCLLMMRDLPCKEEGQHFKWPFAVTLKRFFAADLVLRVLGTLFTPIA